MVGKLSRSNGSSWAFRVCLVSSLLLGSSWYAEARQGSDGVTVILNHARGFANPSGTIELRKNQHLHVRIEETNADCFTYNAARATPAPGIKAMDASHPDTVLFDIIHDGKTPAYKISVVKRTGADPAKCTLDNREWQIDVTTLEWSIAFAGGFTFDKLTNPVFELEKARRTTGDGDATVEGFRVERSRDAQDSYKLGLAAMMHLYHSDDSVLRVGKENRVHLNWVPLSFGLGVSDQSSVRYFVGTSVRAGDKFFLTGGRVFGSVDRLPNGVQEHHFTTDSAALSTLGSRTDRAWFFALSYSILGVDVSPFKKGFEPKSPAPE